MKMQEDIIVVGGGASGMVTAILCARKGHSVLVLEHKKQLGKKILATGNGKCNYTNLHMEPECFRSDVQGFVAPFLERFSAKEAIAFFEELGITPKVKNGYVYPYAEQASAMLEVLRMELERLKVKVVYEQVVAVEEEKAGYLVRTQQQAYEGKYVVLATGGKASAKHGSDGSGLRIAKKMGHQISTPVPALIGLHCMESFYPELAGIRMQAKIWIYIDGATKEIASEQGELQLTKYGISGIPVFQVSRYAAKALAMGQKVEARIDFMPEFSKEELTELLLYRFGRKGRKVCEVLVGLLPDKMIPVILQQSGIKKNMDVERVNEMQLKQLVQQLKWKKTEIVATNGFEQAQVMAGGVAVTEVSNETLESVLHKGLYFVGEILDVDGICGGYNLQWCWTSAYVVSEAIG